MSKKDYEIVRVVVNEMNNIEVRIDAAYQLSLRYMNMKELITDELVEEVLEIIKREKTLPGQKKAARTIFIIKYGRTKANKLIFPIAKVTDRNDSLVGMWTREVKKRDGACVRCGNDRNLHAHHINHWVDDPVNRTNVNNGITLCDNCHSLEHPTIRNLILKTGGRRNG